MRFLPSSPGRAAAEVLLTAAVVAFVVYDLSGHSSVKPEASGNVALSFEAKRPSSTTAAVSSRFEATVSGVTTGNIYTVCGNTSAPANPWVFGNGTNQALVVYLGGGCSPNPAITYFNNATTTTTVSGITVNSGSWLSFQNVQYSTGGSAGATSGPLVMNSGSNLETNISTSIVAVSTTTVIYPLLLSSGACPTFSGVNIGTPINCPNYAYASVVGNYACSVGYQSVTINSASYCNLFLTIVGALSQSSTTSITIQFNQDCSTYTPTQFKAAVFQATGVPPDAINILTWGCGSITVTFLVLGNNAALIAAAVNAIVASAQSGTLYTLLGGVTYVGLGTLPSTYYPLPYCYYNGQTYCGTTSISAVSSSNPALFALLTLLVIPVAIILGIFVWCCLQKEPVCAPLPVCTPAPACFFPEPTCALPCDPCAAGAAPLAYMEAPAAAPLSYNIQ